LGGTHNICSTHSSLLIPELFQAHPFCRHIGMVELALRMHHVINKLLLLLLQVVSSSSIVTSPTSPPKRCQSSLA
jgi:hypothetical protein